VLPSLYSGQLTGLTVTEQVSSYNKRQVQAISGYCGPRRYRRRRPAWR